MKRQEKVSKTFRFDPEVVDHAETNPLIPSFAEWASETYRKEFLQVETLSRKIKDHSKQGTKLQEQLDRLQKKHCSGADMASLLSPQEQRWIEDEGVPRSKQFTSEGVYKAFCSQFKRRDINRKQFGLLIERFDT